MTVAPALQQLLSALPEAEQLEFQSLLVALYKVRYTGFIGIHCKNGLPKQVDLGAPVRLSIVEGDHAPTAAPLDSPAGAKSG